MVCPIRGPAQLSPAKPLTASTGMKDEALVVAGSLVEALAAAAADVALDAVADAVAVAVAAVAAAEGEQAGPADDADDGGS